MALKGKKVFVPVSHVGIGTGTARVIDRRTGAEHAFRNPVIKLVRGVVCVELASQGEEGGHHRVVLPGGVVAWVRAVGPKAGSAA